MDKVINKLRNSYKGIGNKRHEDNVRLHVIINTFMEYYGYEYVLLDFSIETLPKLEGNVLESYIVFWFDIFKVRTKGKTELRYFKYLSFDNLYNNQATHFFCDIAQYKVWKI